MKTYSHVKVVDKKIYWTEKFNLIHPIKDMNMFVANGLKDKKSFPKNVFNYTEHLHEKFAVSIELQDVQRNMTCW